MTIKTRDMGEIEVSSSDIIYFKKPILGFDSLERYVIIGDIELGTDLMWLQSVDDYSICFLIVNPFHVLANYSPTIDEDAMVVLDTDDLSHLTFVAIAVIPDNVKDATVNLKSPIVINHMNKLAAQIVLDDAYSIRFPLVSEVQ